MSGQIKYYEDSGNDRDVYVEQLALTKSSLPDDLKRYWKDRYVLFRKFDQGIELTPELWYSVTPEDVAIFLAKFIRDCNPSTSTLLDLFCGGGGNTIQFARFFDKVFAIDYNETNLKCTLRNLDVYGVRSKVKPIKFDWSKIAKPEGQSLLHALRGEKVDVVFASSPWGGPSYAQQKQYDLDQLEPLSLEPLLKSCFLVSDNVCLFLPRNSNLDQLSEVTRKLGKPQCKVLYVHHTGRLKGITVFWGSCFFY